MRHGVDVNQIVGILGRVAVVLAMLVAFAPAAEADGGEGSGIHPEYCNFPVSGKVVLKRDLICVDSDGLIVMADNTKIYLNGYSIKCWDPDGYKYSCQGGDSVNNSSAPVDPDTGSEALDFGIDTNGKSHVQIIGPGALQGFDIGAYLYGGPGTWSSASHVSIKKVLITGPDGRSDLSLAEINPFPVPDPITGSIVGGVTPSRPASWGILVQNFVEHWCSKKDSDDGHGHGGEVFGNTVDNHVEGIALYNSDRSTSA